MNNPTSIFDLRTEKQHLDLVIRNHWSDADFSYHGYWPSDTYRKKLNTSLGKVLAVAPLRSTLRARLEHAANQYTLHVLISFEAGSFVISATNESKTQALQSTLEQAYAKILSWRVEQMPLASEVQQQEGRHSPRVLIVDDNPISTKLLESCFAPARLRHDRRDERRERRHRNH